jgi:hypothetical protein
MSNLLAVPANFSLYYASIFGHHVPSIPEKIITIAQLVRAVKPEGYTHIAHRP